MPGASADDNPAVPTTPPFRLPALHAYLEQRHQAAVTIEQVRPIGESEHEDNAAAQKALKQFGYGRPLLVTYQLQQGPGAPQRFREVFHNIRRTPFGRERDDDRAAAVWLDYHTFNDLPHHVPAVDMVGLSRDGILGSLHDVCDLILVTTYRPGALYAEDLVYLRDGGDLRAHHVDRARTLAGYLAQIHSRDYDGDPALRDMLWRRRLRDLLGHGEGIFGLGDNYPLPLPYITAGRLLALENEANRWRWYLKPRSERLCQVHGDFHPFNILFQSDDGDAFHILDRSRGAWGAAEDDVSCLSINYLFFSLQRSAGLDEPFSTLYHTFWRAYLQQRPDDGLIEAIQPWFAWRALVLASPIWYPTIDEAVRRKLLAFARNVLATPCFDWQAPSRYFED